MGGCLVSGEPVRICLPGFAGAGSLFVDNRGEPGDNRGFRMRFRSHLVALAGYKRFWAAYAAVLVFDQLTKIIVLQAVPVTPRGSAGTPVIPGFFWISHVYNRGAAWSMGAGNQGLLVLFALATLAAMFHWREKIGLREPAAQWGLGAFAGGAVGNVIDRLAYHQVVDFLTFRIPVVDYYWPTFNIADMGITCGAALYIWQGYRKGEPVAPPADSGAGA